MRKKDITFYNCVQFRKVHNDYNKSDNYYVT